MKGEIKSFTEETQSGSIKGEDEKTYTIKSVGEEVKFSKGQQVTFTVEDGKAIKVRVFQNEEV